MKTLEMNPNEFPHLNSLMLLTWYLISTSYILPSLVLSYCPEHTVSFVLCLYTLPIGIPFINFLVYSVRLFSLTLSFHALFGVFFSKTFKLLFILIFDFLTHIFRSQKKITIKKERKQNHYTNRRQMTEFSPLEFP